MAQVTHPLMGSGSTTRLQSMKKTVKSYYDTKLPELGDWCVKPKRTISDKIQFSVLCIPAITLCILPAIGICLYSIVNKGCQELQKAWKKHNPS